MRQLAEAFHGDVTVKVSQQSYTRNRAIVSLPVHISVHTTQLRGG
jgi:hypothetical protein